MTVCHNGRTMLSAAALMIAAGSSAAYAQPPGIRFFFSTIGLTEPNDPRSPAANPFPEFGINPSISRAPNQPARVYLWAKFEPAGTPNTAVINGIHLVTNLTGVGGSFSGFNFWNYTNGSYGNGTGRWQQFTQSPAGTTNAVSLAGAAVTTGAGVNNSNAAHTQDTQYRRFAPDGSTRIDATLLGWLEFSGIAPGQTVEARITATMPAQAYLGWGDEGIPGNPIPEATIFVTPEPSSIALLTIPVLLLRRWLRAASHT